MEDVKEMEKVEHKSVKEYLQNEPAVAPLVDIIETNNEYTLVAYLPGVEKENINIKSNDNSLTIFGKVDLDAVKSHKYLLKEIPVGNFFRKFNLSDSVDVSKIEAEYSNGVLEMHLHKSEKAKPRTIEIN